MQAATTRIIEEFWHRMASNDFHSVKPLLAADFTLDWPQSNERIRGPENFARLNAEYPANGPWRFTINRLTAGDNKAVTDVSITDGVIQARAISFFTLTNGLISHITEYWPEPYEPPSGRAHLTEPLAP